MRTLVFSLFLASALAAACASPTAAPLRTSRAESLGTPGVPTAADHGCNVVLRDLELAVAHGKDETNCSGTGADETCFLVFSGDLDLSAEAVNEGDTPYVYYQSGSDPTWYTASAYETTGGGVGMERFAFSLVTNTEVKGAPRQTMQVIPFLQTVVGTQLFDHNEYAGNYILSKEAGWAIHPDGTTCYDPPPPASGTVAFAAAWTETLTGALNAGGKLTVDYDLARMPGCEGVSTDGVSAWNTQAYAYFEPGGELLQGSVKGYYDTEQKAWQNQIFAEDIPYDATSVELWFETSGDGCTTSWDSNYGANYVYAVGAPLFPPESGPTGSGGE
jgi:hypothetical protein